MKMKGLVKAVFLSAILVVCSGLAFAAPPAGPVKVATISIQKVLAGSRAAQEAQKILQAEVDRFQAKFKGEEDALTAMKNEIEKKSSAWSEEMRVGKERDYQKKVRDYGLKTEDAKQEVQQLEKQVMEPILKHLHEIIAEVGKKHGYTLILENTMKGLRNRTGLLYADDNLDISDQIQKELDSRLKK